MVPDGLEPSLPGCKPGVVAAGPRDRIVICDFRLSCSPNRKSSIENPRVDPSGIAPESPVCRTGVFLLDHEPKFHFDAHREFPNAEAVGLEPTSDSWPPPVFETSSSSGRMTSVDQISDLNFRELESNQRLLVQSQVSRPTATVPELFPSFPTVRGGGLEPRITGFKVRYPTFRRSPITSLSIQSVLWESNPPVQLGRLAPLPLGQRHISFCGTRGSRLPQSI